MFGRKAFIALAAAAALALLPATSGAQAPVTTSTHYTGALPDGGSWIADFPSPWNGTLLLYSHGYGQTTPADSPDPGTQQALLNEGYALAGSSYDPTGSLWQMGSAVRDQFETLADVEQTVLPSRPKQVIAVGTSMGGLISSIEAEQSYGRLDGALTTCGIVAGGEQLGNYQLDGEYALDQLLAGGVGPARELRRQRPASGRQRHQRQRARGGGHDRAVDTRKGQARLALAMALLNTTTWSVDPGAVPPAPNDYAGQELQEFDTDFGAPAPFPVMVFIRDRAPADRARGRWKPELDGRGQLLPAGLPVLLPAPDRGPVSRRRARPQRRPAHPGRARRHQGVCPS